MDKLEVFTLTHEQFENILKALDEVPQKYSRALTDFFIHNYKEQLEKKKQEEKPKDAS